MKKRLTIPARLSVTVLLASACSDPAQTSDAATDARADTAMDAALDAVADVLHDSACLDAERPPIGEPGFACTPRADTVGRVECGAARVCDPAECPTGCDGCNEPNFCIPEMAGTTCLSNLSCSADGAVRGAEPSVDDRRSDRSGRSITEATG